MRHRTRDAIIGRHLMPRSRARFLFSPLRLVMPVLLATMLHGCATAKPVQAEQAKQASTAGDDAVTVENLLRWPLEGRPAGTDKVEAGLREAFDLKELKPSWFTGSGPVEISDGYFLSFTWIRQLTGTINIGVKEDPCFPTERAVELTGAIQNQVVHDAHGIDRGKTYDVRRNGVWVYFDTTPTTYRCVTSISIRPIKGRE